jgi:hypothetical protein
MATGTTIQVFLPDGNPRSLKIAETTNSEPIVQNLNRITMIRSLAPKEEDK